MKKVSIGKATIELVEGDITDTSVDAIVNAANRHLAGGGGVDGAIHRRGGPSIIEETTRRYPDGCPTGSAVISGAGALPARYVIHAVGPFWNGGHSGEETLLASAYRHSLQIARDHHCTSIAFPALSTGAYRYPLDRASQTAVQTIVDELKQHRQPERVQFVLFSDDAYEAFQTALAERTDA